MVGGKFTISISPFQIPAWLCQSGHVFVVLVPSAAATVIDSNS